MADLQQQMGSQIAASDILPDESRKTDLNSLQGAGQSNTGGWGCPTGCNCQGSTVDCSRVSSHAIAESRVNVPGAIYELPDMPDDVPVYVTRIKMNDSRIKRIRQTSLFKQLANSQKM